MSWFADIRLSRKIGLAFTGVVAVILLAGLVIHLQFRVLDDSAERAEQVYQTLLAAEQAQGAFNAASGDLRLYAVSGDRRFLSRYRDDQVALDERLAGMQDLTVDEQARTILRDVEAGIRQWREEMAEPLIALAERDLEAAQQDVIQREDTAAMVDLRAALADLIARQDAILERARDRESRASANAFLALVLGGLAAVVLSVFFGGALTRATAAPVREMTETMKHLASGELDVEIQGVERKDELGRMAAALEVWKRNAMERVRLEKEQAAARQRREARAERLEELMTAFDAEVSESLKTLGAASTELDSSAQGLASTAEETTQQSASVAAGAEQAEANVQTVASSAQQLSASIDEISRQVNHSSEIAVRASDEAVRTNETVRGLERAADKIGEVVTLIQDIAEQTNLLALNATIEAARAGDAGKGFAVVANEVKSLANQTAKATEQIEQEIASVQSQTKTAAEAIDSISRTVNEIKDVSNSIASAVEEQGAATQEIARNVREAAEGTTDITRNIGGVSEAARDASAAASQLTQTAGEVAQQTDSVNRQVDAFLENVRNA